MKHGEQKDMMLVQSMFLLSVFRFSYTLRTMETALWQ
jgi:hypothetical protein